MTDVIQPDEICVTMPQLIFRDIRVEGSLLCTPKQAQEMLDLVTHHNVSVKTNSFYGLEKLPELIELVRSGKLKGKGIIIVDEDGMRKERQASSKLV